MILLLGLLHRGPTSTSSSTYVHMFMFMRYVHVPRPFPAWAILVRVSLRRGENARCALLLSNHIIFMGKPASALQTAIAKKSVQGATLKACGAMAQSRYTRVKVLFEKRK